MHLVYMVNIIEYMYNTDIRQSSICTIACCVTLSSVPEVVSILNLRKESPSHLNMIATTITVRYVYMTNNCLSSNTTNRLIKCEERKQYLKANFKIIT